MKKILKCFGFGSEERNRETQPHMTEVQTREVRAQQPEKPTVPAGEQVQQEVPQEPAPAVLNAPSADSGSVPSSSVPSDCDWDPPSFGDWLN